MKKIYDYTLEEIQSYLIENSIPKFRAKQIWNFLYIHNVEDFDMMHTIPIKERQILKDNFVINSLEMTKYQKSSDGTKKALLKLDNEDYIETVLMKYAHGYSVCVTTQIGCQIGCSFCASHLGGFKRNLSGGEIVEQVMFWQKELVKNNNHVSNIVVMGIGEPFTNLTNVLKFIDIINDKNGLNIGARKITVSTSGIVPGFDEFIAYDKQINLAVSLHAPNDELRSRIMKINKVYNIESLMNAVKKYLSAKNRQVTFEYILLDKVNDSEKEAKEIINLVRGLDIHINLIPYNSISEDGYKKADVEKIKRFENILKSNNISVTVRQQKGNDIDGACGQLRRKGLN